VVFVVWRIGESRSSGRCETLSFRRPEITQAFNDKSLKALAWSAWNGSRGTIPNCSIVNSSRSFRAGIPRTSPPSSRIIPSAPPGGSGRSTYLLNVFRKKLGYPDLKRAVREQHRLFGASTVLIEDKASGTQLIQELVEEGPFRGSREEVGRR
jgi:hypothetical protein